jgi:hypothetical protein
VNEGGELAAIFLLGNLDVRGFLHGLDAGALQRCHGGVGDDGRPVDLFTERTFATGGAVGRLLVTSLDDDIAVDDFRGHSISPLRL